MSRARKAITLVELLVIVGILVTLVVMTMPAIIHMRAFAARLESTNNLRTIMQAMQQYSINHGGKLPGISPSNIVMNTTRYPLYVLLPYLDIGFKEPWGTFNPNYGMEYPQVKVFLSPTDLSNVDQTMPMSIAEENASYSSNALVFDGMTRMSGIDDGLSHTIGFSERYRGCWSKGVNTSTFSIRGVYPDTGKGSRYRMSTFADAGYNDVLPVTVNGISQPSVPNVTFQQTPTVENATGSLLQSTQPAGLLTVMMDGSVKTIGNHVTPVVFWGSITPRGNEIINLD